MNDSRLVISDDRFRRHRLCEPDEPALGPIPIIATVGVRHEATTSAAPGDDGADVWIAAGLSVAKDRGRDERVVFRSNHKRRDADAVDDAHRTGAKIVVVGVL